MPITHALTRSPERRPRRPVPVAVTLAAVPALALSVALAAPVNAYAAVAGDGNGNGSAVRVGNGSANRTMVAIGSTRLRGVLHQLSTGVGGLSSVQGGLCRPRARLCALSQNIRARSDGPGGRRAARH
ncbi:hypothetical protein [Microbispora sp. H13382]|uniref:hypothetical protein n=1 Tax=Microbispora sp. H13382 TaxID=2729112 RepID=UPI0016002CAD|nr:hypothetical protein [Microbispora sp. H13382]